MSRKDILRKLLLIIIAMINSEVLSTAQTFSTVFSDPLLFAIYLFSFVLIDELVQRYDFGNLAIFYTGAIFGLILEGFVAFTLVTDPLAPFVMIPLIAILWHGLITTLVTFTVVETLVPRKGKKVNQTGVVLSATFWMILLLITIGTNFATIASNSFVYVIILLLLLAFLLLIKNSLKTSTKYKPKTKLSILLIILGLIANLLISERAFAFMDYFLMLVFYITITALLLKREQTLTNHIETNI